MNERKTTLSIFNIEFESDFIEFYDFLYSTIKERDGLFGIMKVILSNFLIEPLIPVDLKNEFLFFKSIKGKDYDKLFFEISSQCQYDKHVIDLNSRKSILGFWGTLKVLRKVKLRSLQKNNFSYRVFVFSYLLFITKVLAKAKSWRCDFYVSFADMQPIENVLTQFFKKQGVFTSTMQHGLYVDYSASPNINVVNYKNVVADNFLAWGEETKQLIELYKPGTNVHVLGKTNLNLKPSGEDSGYFTLIFDQVLFKDFNKKLLAIGYELANLTGYQMNIRIHPRDNINNYDIEQNSSIFIDEDISGSIFILGHTTSLIYELLSQGFKVFKLRSDVPANKGIEVLEFDDSGELLNLVKLQPTINPEYYIKYVGKEAKIKYREFFSKIHENNSAHIY